MPHHLSDHRGPFGRNLADAQAIRSAVRSAGLQTPIVAAGGIHGFDQAETVLANGQADIVAAARQSLADPDWWLKIRRGQGAQVRVCGFSNYCEGLDQKHKQVTCKLWDRSEPNAPVRALSTDGKRRLEAPPWEGLHEE